MSMVSQGNSRPFALTGRHVLVMVLGFFGLIFAANGVMIWLALESFPGVATDSAYKASQSYNREIAAAAAQTARGWTVAASARRVADGRVAVRVEATAKDGRPVGDASFRAILERPMHRADDRTIELSPAVGASGAHVAFVEDLAPGQWDLVVEADGKDGRLFLSRNRVILDRGPRP